MQQGAGVRQMVEDELRKSGKRLRDLDVALELGCRSRCGARSRRLRRRVHLAERGRERSSQPAGSPRRASRARPRARHLHRARDRPGRVERRAGVRRLRARAAGA
jgi:hypothetical protein